jgi:acyl-coenzyme A thioesterase PaaI-like protein
MAQSVGPVQELYPPAIRGCFGCGADNPEGLQVQSFWDGRWARASFTPGPEHRAYPGVVNGGVIATLMDCHGLAAAWCEAYQRRGDPPGRGEPVEMVTGRLEVDYLAPAPLGPELRLEAEVAEAGAKKTVVQCRLWAGEKECARGRVVCVRLARPAGEGKG